MYHDYQRTVRFHKGLVRAVSNDYEKTLRDFKRFLDEYRVVRKVIEAHAPHAGVAMAKQAKKSVTGDTGVDVTASTGGGNGAGGDDGDGDGGDGDGDGDGPRRPSRSPRRPNSRSSPRAARRSFIPKFLTHHAFAWLVALALLLAYIAPPSFAALFVQLGQPELAKEMLHYQPKLLMPLPAGWSTPG